MTAEQRDQLMLRILQNIQKRLTLLEGRQRRMQKQLTERMTRGFKSVTQRIDQHRAFAIDRLRDHERRLGHLESS